MKREQRKRHAFMLLELVIVVLLIAVFMGMALVSVDSLVPISRLKKQSRTTADIFEFAFSTAAINGRDLAIYFRPEENAISLEYYIEEDSDEEFLLDQLSNDNGEELLELKPILVKKWDESIKLEEIEIYTQNLDEDERDFILFSPEGMCDGAKIIWREESGIKQEVELWPLLGKVTIKPVDHSEAL